MKKPAKEVTDDSDGRALNHAGLNYTGAIEYATEMAEEFIELNHLAKDARKMYWAAERREGVVYEKTCFKSDIVSQRRYSSAQAKTAAAETTYLKAAAAAWEALEDKRIAIKWRRVAKREDKARYTEYEEVRARTLSNAKKLTANGKSE